jgi:hypothetical protein
MKKVLLLLILSFPVLLYAQSAKHMNKPRNQHKEKKQQVYLAKTDSIFIIVKSHAVADLQTSAKRANPSSEENKRLAEEMKLWDEEKQNKYSRLFQTSVHEYLQKVDLDFDTFLLLFPDFGGYDVKVMAAYDFRVRHIGANQYAGEFWEDGLEANSEANALVWAHTILEKRHGDSITITNTVKETYASARKAIMNGKQPRYTKVMALLYTKEGSEMVFHDPFQALRDFR